MPANRTQEDREVIILKLKAVDQFIDKLERFISRTELGIEQIQALSGGISLQTVRRNYQGGRREPLPPDDGQVHPDLTEERAVPTLEQAIDVMRLVQDGATEGLSSPSLIHQDMERVEADFGPEHAQCKEEHLRIAALCRVVLVTEEDAVVQTKAVLENTSRLIALLRGQAEVAKRLRAKLIGQLNQEVSTTQKKTGKRGRPKNPETAKRDKKMLEAWDTGGYKTFEELGRAYGTSGEVARKGVDRARRQARQRSR